MVYLIVQHKVPVFEKHLSVIQLHKKAQNETDFVNPDVCRDHQNPQVVICRIEVTDIQKANDFVNTQQARKDQQETASLETQEIIYLKVIKP
ncbi:MAG: hypothetical protein KQI35_02705 [Bacteroidetes bacterium]|nr:hypothetical protein [Bacteroidota bacterium]